MALRILLADDHELVREGLRLLLQGEGLEVVGEARDGDEAVRLAHELVPDIIILDVGMPRLNGIDAARAILRNDPRAKTVVVSVHGEDVLDAIRAGVRGYVLKKQCFADLNQAINDVSRGATYVSPALSRRLQKEAHLNGGGNGKTLTSREREVLQLVAEGNTSKEVASLLAISVKTVDSHRSNIMSKLDVHDTAGLVRYAVRKGIVEP